MMKKLFALLVVLALCGAANAGYVTFDQAGESINATAGQEITFTVTGSALLSLDALFTVTGTGAITGYMTNADAGTYGWDTAGFPITPIAGASSVEIGGGNFNGNKVAAPGQVGYVKITYNGGTVTVNMAAGSSFGGSYNSDGMSLATVNGGTATIIPEPMTIALLGLGGLFIRRRK